MLDDAKQVAAFRLLQAAGSRTAHNWSVSKTAIKTAAESIKNALTAVILTGPNGKQYPANVTAQITRLTAITALMDSVTAAAGDMEALLSPYTTIHELVNLSIGFDCYVKANALPVATPFPLVDAIAQTGKVDALTTALNALSVTDIVAKMNAVNTAITQAAAVPPATTPGAWTTPTAKQVTDLTASITAQDAAVTSIRTALTVYTQLHADGLKSRDDARQAFNDAVEIALIVALKSDARMGAAINALVPANVLAALA